MREMKETNVVWCPEIPHEWHIEKVKNNFDISKDTSTVSNPTVLKLARSGICIKDVTSNEGQMAESYDNYNKVIIGDLLLNPMDLYSGANCNVSEVEGVISPAYVNLRAKKELNSKYFDYYFKIQYWAMAMFAHGKGVSFDNRWTINAEGVKNYEIPIPTVDEQNNIVAVIDKKISQVDTLISNQEKQIEKLKAYKQSLITEVVTKGLDPTVPMKDSGAEELGKVPEHWVIKRTKFIADSIIKGNGITKDEVLSDGDIQCIRYGEIYSKYEGSIEKTFSKTKISIIEKPQYIKKGNLLFAGTGELVEEIGKNIVYMGNESCLAGGDIIVLTHSQNPIFLNYALYCISSQKQKSKGKAKLKVVHISASEIGNIIVALPPLDEQNDIAKYLNIKCLQIDELIAIKQKKIEKLNQYKKSLIYEYVTGKKEA